MIPLPGRPKGELTEARSARPSGWRSMMTVGAACSRSHAQAQRRPTSRGVCRCATHARRRLLSASRCRPSVYEGAVRADLGDLRVFNGDGAAGAARVPRASPAAAREAAAPVALPLFPLRVDRDRRDVGDLTLSVRRDAAGTTVEPRHARRRAGAGERLAGYVLDASALESPLVALTLVLPDGASVRCACASRPATISRPGAFSTRSRRSSTSSSAASA